jgi:hypothetical protein
MCVWWSFVLNLIQIGQETGEVRLVIHYTPLEAYDSRQTGFHQTHSSSAFITDLYVEFHENLMKHLLADTNLLTHGQTDIYGLFLRLCPFVAKKDR